ncbi:hypothetical protein pb186bvf_019059 [Paramecium bursaria]
MIFDNAPSLNLSNIVVKMNYFLYDQVIQLFISEGKLQNLQFEEQFYQSNSYIDYQINFQIQKSITQAYQ